MTASDAAVVLFVFSFATVSADKVEVSSTTLQNTVWALHAGDQRVDNVLATLAGVTLSLGTPVKTQVDRFTLAVGELELLASEVRERAAAMQSQGDDYFRRWDQELAQLHDEDRVIRSVKRRQAVQAQCSKLQAGFMRVNTGFTQFLADLGDIRVLLGHDLSRQAVVEIKRLRAKVTASAPPLHEALGKLEEAFKSLGQELTLVGQPDRQ